MKYLKEFFQKHKTLILLISFFVSTHILLELIGLFSIYYSSHSTSPMSLNNSISIWCQWDCGWYKDIAQNGYSSQIKDYGQANYVFFPLFPIAMYLGSLITHDVILSGFIISNFASIIALVYLYKLLRLDFSNEDSFTSIKWLIAIPTSFLLTTVMSEAIFMALLVSAFYYARIHKFWIVGILGLLMTLTRSIGFFMLIPLFYEYLIFINFDSKQIKKEILSFVMFPVGLLIWMLYNFHLVHDPIGFLTIQKAWEKTPVLSTRKFIRAFIKGDFEILFDFFYLMSLIPLIVWGRTQLRTSYLMLIVLAILIPLPGGFQSMPRYLLIAFPLYILLMRFEKKFGQYSQMLLVISGVLQGFLMVAWSNGYTLLR